MLFALLLSANLSLAALASAHTEVATGIPGMRLVRGELDLAKLQSSTRVSTQQEVVLRTWAHGEAYLQVIIDQRRQKPGPAEYSIRIIREGEVSTRWEVEMAFPFAERPKFSQETVVMSTSFSSSSYGIRELEGGFSVRHLILAQPCRRLFELSN